MIPSMFPPTVQIELLSRLFHRDLSNKDHQTNIHLHYDVTYPGEAQEAGVADGPTSPDPGQPRSQFSSFFADDPARVIYPKDPETHKPITVQNLLEKRLRWITLGGQYDWTAKAYPEGPPPPFPNDVGEMLRAAFPETEAQAAILNVYSAGDTLSAHRDVSEECDVGLISVSFGCDGLFMISHDDGVGCAIIRLRSGDAVYMNGASRFAWHGVPKVLSDTCPNWLADWPSFSETDASQYELWKGWMSGKRVNLNVRQMTNSTLNEKITTGH